MSYLTVTLGRVVTIPQPISRYLLSTGIFDRIAGETADTPQPRRRIAVSLAGTVRAAGAHTAESEVILKTMARVPRPGERKSTSIPFPFIVDALAPLDPRVRPMFGGHSVYIGDKVVFMLRDHQKSPEDNGLWLIFANDFDAGDAPKALRKQFPSLRPIRLLSGKIKHWLVIPAKSPSFESESLSACDLLLARDPRLGRIPKSRQKRPGNPRSRHDMPGH
jgi:hypothetical protein